MRASMLNRAKVYRYLVALVIVVASGCASYPTSLEAQAGVDIRRANEAVLNNDADEATQQILLAVEKPTGEAQIRAYFQSNPNAAALIVKRLNDKIKSLQNPAIAINLSQIIDRLNKAEVFNRDSLAQVALSLNRQVEQGTVNRTLRLTLGDDLNRFSNIRRTPFINAIFDMTIEDLQQQYTPNRRAKLIGLTEYLVKEDSQADFSRVESLLSTFNIKRTELDITRQLYTAFSADREKQLSVLVKLHLIGGDLLLEEDIKQSIQERGKGIIFAVPGRSDIDLIVERVRHEEKVSAERTQTITYAQHEVDLGSALLLMPRNASYLYEYVSGVAEIDYGYVLRFAQHGLEPTSVIARGKLGGSYGRCQNRRIQNVFGGVSSASFIANDDMQRRCAVSSEVSIEELRKQEIEKIVDAIISIPAIAKVAAMN